MENNKINIYLDDCPIPPKYKDPWADRDIPTDWTICRTLPEFIDLINNAEVAFVSFDYNLGHLDTMNGKTGADAAREVLRLVQEGKLPPFDWQAHTGDFRGKHEINQIMVEVCKLWKEQGFNLLDYSFDI
jgi:hypothetical protein